MITEQQFLFPEFDDTKTKIKPIGCDPRSKQLIAITNK